MVKYCKLYYLIREVYESALAFSHGFSVRQNLIYIPNKAVIAQNPHNKDEFFYLKNKDALKQAEEIAENKGEGLVKEIEIENSKIEEIINLGEDIINSKNQFKDRIKSLGIF